MKKILDFLVGNSQKEKTLFLPLYLLAFLLLVSCAKAVTADAKAVNKA